MHSRTDVALSPTKYTRIFTFALHHFYLSNIHFSLQSHSTPLHNPASPGAVDSETCIRRHSIYSPAVRSEQQSRSPQKYWVSFHIWTSSLLSLMVNITNDFLYCNASGFHRSVTLSIFNRTATCKEDGQWNMSKLSSSVYFLFSTVYRMWEK